MPGLEDLRRVIVAAHPRAARIRAGGPPRMLPIAQVLADWCTPRGQAIVMEAQSREGLARSVARREGQRLSPDQRAAAEEREFVAARGRALEALAALGRQWEREDRERAAQTREGRKAA